jgi:hypothetical protein
MSQGVSQAGRHREVGGQARSRQLSSSLSSTQYHTTGSTNLPYPPWRSTRPNSNKRQQPHTMMAQATTKRARGREGGSERGCRLHRYRTRLRLPVPYSLSITLPPPRAARSPRVKVRASQKPLLLVPGVSPHEHPGTQARTQSVRAERR